LFTDINGADTESPTDADRRLTGKIIYLYIKDLVLMFHKGFFLDALLTLLISRFDFDYQGLMDIRNAEIFTVFC
jgi:hypothetical protein